jgi:hypothetical protein
MYMYAAEKKRSASTKHTPDVFLIFLDLVKYSGKHQENMVPYDPYIHRPSALGRPALPTQSSSSSLTPRIKAATVAPAHSPAASSLVDWPVPGERSGADDRDDEGSALPATASWAKIGSNPSTPTLINSLPLSRKLTEPPPLHAKGSTTSIITGVVVNNASKDTSESPTLDCKSHFHFLW